MSYWARSFISQWYLHFFESLLLSRVNFCRHIRWLLRIFELVSLVRMHISRNWREWTRGAEDLTWMSRDNMHLVVNCGRGSMDATFKELLLLLLLRLIQLGIILLVIRLVLEGVICGTNDIHSSVLKSATWTGNFTVLWLKFSGVYRSSLDVSAATVNVGELLKVTWSTFKVSSDVTSFMLLITIIVLLKTAKFVELLLLG